MSESVQMLTDCNQLSDNFTRTSSYRSNRDNLLSTLRDRSSLESYSNVTVGPSPNTVYGMFLCRGDINRTSCSNCIYAATLSVAETCNSHKGASIFYDECIVQYSNVSFFTLVEDAPAIRRYSASSSLGSSDFFNQTLPGKIYELILRAFSSSLSSPIPYFAEDREHVTQLEGSYDLKALVQCSLDLDPRNCTECLRLAVKDFFECCSHARLAQIIFPKCLVMYNVSALQPSLGVINGSTVFGYGFSKSLFLKSRAYHCHLSGNAEDVTKARFSPAPGLTVTSSPMPLFHSYVIFIPFTLCFTVHKAVIMRWREDPRLYATETDKKIHRTTSIGLTCPLVGLLFSFESGSFLRCCVQCFSGKRPDVFFTGDCRTSLGASASSVQIPARTPYSQRSPLFLSPGTDELFHPPFEEPLTPSDTRYGSSPWLDLKSFRSFLSLSFPTMMMPAFSLLRNLVGRRQSSLGDSSFKGGGKFSLGEDFSASTLGKCSSFYTVLLSYVAVCTGPEDASETTSVYLVGENWVSTSLVTNFQLSDFVVKLLSTHSSFALNSLSSSHEDLSILASFAYVVYAYNQRGCLIPSSCTVVPKNIEV
ncbi:hypothetical protein F2Q68_00019432 [Brassica cretica]|uniref:Gnk2-homologous domain-containing protein n=1 Tax=Brassica cretica TaxID=69181 RepID=A0A8S9G5Y7_BRACR|nr:hypothetical protein F2Q68_00019432 [Brassica cretica]